MLKFGWAFAITWHLRTWVPHVHTLPFEVDLPGQTSLTYTHSFPFRGQKGKPWCTWGDGLALEDGLGSTRIKFLLGCFLTSFNLFIWNFLGPDFSSFLTCPVLLISVGFLNVLISRKRGSRNWTSNDQGQLHLRSLILCSLASAPLLITAHVFPVEWKGATVGLENYTCVDSQSKCIICGKSVVLNAKKILLWKLLSFVVLDLFSTTYLMYH